MHLRQHCSTLVELIKGLSIYEDRGVHFIESSSQNVFFSYKYIFNRAQDVARALRSKGIQPGNELVFQFTDNKNFVICFWACIISGIIPVPLSIGNSDEQKLKITNVWKLLKAPFLVTEKSVLQGSFFPGPDRVIYIEELACNSNDEIINIPNENDIAFIQFSSGSTGTPKGVILTHKNLLVNINAIHKGIQSPDSGDLFCSWMPLTHDMGLIGFHLTPLYAGWNHFIMPTELFIRNPNLWLNKISEHKISFTASPNFGYRYVLKHIDRSKCLHLDLSCLRVIVNGAEPISADLCHEFVEKMASFGLRKSVIFPVYGLAEASLAVTFSQIEHAIVTTSISRHNLGVGKKVFETENLKDGLALVEVGKPVDDCEIRITDESNNALPGEHIGYIQIKGENVTRGYYGNDEKYNEAVTKDGWLNTGDIGFLKNNRLYITGRQKDILFINGKNYYSHDIERCAETVQGVELGKIAVTGYFDQQGQRDKIIAFLLYKGKMEQFRDIALTLKKCINQSFNFEFDSIIPVKEIPKTTSGKVQRYLLLNRYLDKQYAETEQALKEITGYNLSQEKSNELPDDGIEKVLVDIWSRVLGNSAFGIHDKFFEIGGNSLKVAEMIALIEREWNIQLAFKTAFEKQTIAELAREVNRLSRTIVKLAEELPVNRTDALSASQKRMYQVWTIDRQSLAYNVPLALEIKGVVNKNKLEFAFKELITRHELLRTGFSIYDTESLRKKSSVVPFDLKFYKVEKANISNVLRSLVQPFDLNNPPLFRACLLSVAHEYSLLFLDFHHIIMDGVSVYKFIEELFKIYSGMLLEPLACQYADYVEWELENRVSEAYIKQEKFWLSQLDGELPILNLPTSFPRPASLNYSGKKIKIEFDPSLIEGLKILSLKNNASLYMVLFAVYNVVLSKYSLQEDIIVGVPVAGRYKPEFMQTIGMFVNNLAIRSFPKGDKTFTEFLDEIKEHHFNAFDNRMYEFGQLIIKLDLRRDISRNPLFDTMFIYQNMELPSLVNNDISISRFFLDPGISKYDLSLEVFDTGNSLEFYFEYNTSLFSDETIHRLAEGFNHICESILKAPNSKISALSVISKEQSDFWVYKMNNSGADYPVSKCVHKLFEQRVNLSPEAVAIMYAGRSYTYKEVNNFANGVADQLIKNGITTESVVAVLLDRKPELIVAILAILKSVACFLPIDGALPEERIMFLLRDSKAKIVLTESSLANKISNDWLGQAIFMDSMGEMGNCEYMNPDRENSADDLAYILYTSGTTGKPKGVMITHKGLVNYSFWAANTYFGNEKMCIPLFTSVSFDLTITSIFPPLISGNTIDIYNSNDQLIAIDDIFKKNRVDIIKVTPSHLKVISESNFFLTQCKELNIRKIIVGGENLSAHLAKTIHEGFGGNVEIYNEYGPTEATVGCMIYKYLPSANYSYSVPIGHPINNVQTYVLDQYQGVVPVGVSGELYIAGDCLSQGYWNRQDLTNVSFLANPFIPGKKMYKTGDIAKRLPNGNIEYIGRTDEQIKIKGHRIELAEIEAQLKEYVKVKDAKVIKQTRNNEPFLVAYILPDKEYVFDAKELKDYLSKKLPYFMVPAYYKELDAIPLNRNGKLDLSALPEPDLVNVHANEGPRNEVEELILSIWQSVLNVTGIGIHDNFFDLGGDSVKAIQIVSRLFDAGYAVEIKQVLQHQTIAQLALNIREANRYKYEQGIVSGEFGFSQITKWFFSKNFYNPHYYNQSVLLKFTNKIDVTRLAQTLKMVVQHHDGLRINYNEKDGVLYYNPAHVGKDIVIDVFTFDIPDEEVGERFYQIGGQIKAGFNIKTDLLLKAALLLVQGDQYYLLITAHHLVIDTVSWRIILEDLYRIYYALLNRNPFELPSKTASLIDWYNGFNKKQNELPKKHGHSVNKRNAIDDVTANQIRVRLDLSPDLTEQLIGDIHKKYKISCEIVLLTALMKALYETQGTASVNVELESHGRDLQEINVSKTVGWFTALYHAGLKLTGSSIAEQVMGIKEQVRTLYGSNTGPEINANDPDIRFNYLGQFDFYQYSDLFEISDWDTGPDIDPSNHNTAAVEVICQIRDSKLTTVFTCAENIANSEIIFSMAKAYDKYIVDIIDYLRNSDELHFTPSDFKNADISQEELDSLFG